jgi:hypothetical protein
MDNPTRQLSYKITSPIPNEGDDARWTYNVTEAQKAYELGFLVHKYEIVKAKMSTRQELTTGLATEWRGQ